MVKMDPAFNQVASRSILWSLVALISVSLHVCVIHGKMNGISDTLTQEEDLVSCPENWDLFTTEKICLSRPSNTEVQTRDAAQQTCRTQGGYLASATDHRMDFILENYAINPNDNHAEMHFWMNYMMIHNNINSSHWTIAIDNQQTNQPPSQPTGKFPTSVSKNLSDNHFVCMQLLFKYNRDNIMETWEWKPEDCKKKVPFMCEKPAAGHCVDRKGNIIDEGEQFSPQGQDDPCVRCHCYQSIASVCSTARCGQPSCDHFIRDPDECCKFNCIDSNGNIFIPQDHGGGSPPVYLNDNMRWVLTMVTSFLLLGMMLFMVYRMRQKRLAYLRYRVRQLQEAQMDFEPGSGPPVPSVDDLDHGFFREPPPPYSLFKTDGIGIDSPPPYQHSCINHSRRLNFERVSERSDEVSLLRQSVTGSVPASPASEQTSAPVFITPPESPNPASPDEESVALTATQAPSESDATTPIESTATTPLTANISMASFFGDPLSSPGRNTAV